MSSCNSQSKKNDLYKLNLVGKVKAITETHFTAIERFGEIVKGEQERLGTNSFFFNETGYLIETNDYDYTKIYQKKKYKYDAQGHLLEMDVYTNTVEKDGELTSKFIYEYDKKGNNIFQKVYEWKGALIFTITRSFDDAGNVEEERIKQGSKFLAFGADWKKRYKYDENGNIIQMMFYTPPEIFDYTESYEYKNGILISMKRDRNYIKVYKYDENKNIIEENEKTDTIMSIYKYTYRYDDKGNWISKVQYRGEEAIKLTERDIEYYK